MALGDERRATGARIEAERRAVGRRIEGERRATGRRIESERTGKSVAEDINSLVQPTRQRRTLRTVASVGALPVTRGRANYTPPAPGTGSGVASPFTEGDYALREFYDPRYLQTTDGIFSWEFLPVKKIIMTDANGAAVEQIFAEPT